MSRAKDVWKYLGGLILAVALLAWVSFGGGGWGYFGLYAGSLLVLAVVTGLAWAAHRLLHRDDGASRARRDITRRILRSFVLAELTLGGAILGVALIARLGSGPVGPFAGGPFREVAAGPLPASLAPLEVEEIQLQIPSDPPYSITTHGFVIDGALVVGADFFFPFKRWIHVVQRDPRVLVRIEGRVYRCRVRRVQDPEESRSLLEEVSRQRGVEPTDWLTDVWFFKMEPAP